MKTPDLSLVAAIVLSSVIGFHGVAKERDRNSIQGSIFVKGKSKSEFSSLAKISIQEAISIARKSTSGKVIEVALQKEDDFLVYEIEILSRDQGLKEVFVDAGDGRVLLVKDEEPENEDADDER